MEVGIIRSSPCHLIPLCLDSVDRSGSVVTISGSFSELSLGIFNGREEDVRSCTAKTAQQLCLFVSLLNHAPNCDVFGYYRFLGMSVIAGFLTQFTESEGLSNAKFQGRLSDAFSF